MSNDELQAHDRRIGENAGAVAELRQTVRELTERVEQLEQVVDSGMGAVEYQQMTRKDKVRQIRAYLYDEAQASATKAASMTYKEVRTLFDGRPSAGTAYNLMEAAATIDGFEYERFDGDRTNRLKIAADEINEDAAFQVLNNRAASNPA